MNTCEIGRFCEQQVCRYLSENGFEIVDTNFHCREGELDIIAREAEYTVFVEVKARKSALFGEPCEAVTPKKQKKLIMAAQRYLMQNECETALRFDVVEILYTIHGGSICVNKINHIRAAFEEG